MAEPGPLVDPATVPGWLRALVEASDGLDGAVFPRRNPPPRPSGRPAAVLMLFSDDRDVLLLRRADSLGSHAGQVAFPGGAADDTDDGPVHTAVREAAEEVGVQSDGVRALALFPELLVPVSGFLVTPVLAHWQQPCAVGVVDQAETAAVARVPIAELTDPRNRFQVRHPSGFVGPAFAVPKMLVWGFTAGVLSGLLELAGWQRQWDVDDVRELAAAWAEVGA